AHVVGQSVSCTYAARMVAWMRVGLPQGNFVDTIAHRRVVHKGGAGSASLLAHHRVCNRDMLPTRKRRGFSGYARRTRPR
ncbi:MAG TPA: hypothetical protein VGT44_01015, partial [Ktedonobacteraceae bacterium]|nr:hypothetical protein [Ktedonobacteraceae bacterium]